MLPQLRKATAYRLVDNGGTTVVHAVAQGASSGLAFNVDIDPRAFPVARWRWNVPRPIPGADNTVREGDDAPARVEFIFSGDTGALPLDERLFFAQVKALTGVDIPYATPGLLLGCRRSGRKHRHQHLDRPDPQHPRAQRA
jgi:hypothetical protein